MGGMMWGMGAGMAFACLIGLLVVVLLAVVIVKLLRR